VTLRARLQRFVYQAQHKSRYRTLNRIELNRAAVLHNVHLLQAQHSHYRIIPVLKGNAYGHGLREMAEVLNSADCDLLAVDGYFEAGKIRHLTRHRLLVLGYILPENTKLLDTVHCSFVVQDIAGLEAFGRLCRPVKVHMEINTGMNRLGLRPSEIGSYLAVFQRFPQLELEGIMTHLADADNDSDDSWTNEQAALFDICVRRILAKGFQPRYIHIAQTAGSIKAMSKYANAIRLGLGLYGINPLSLADPHYNDLQGLQPVLELKSTIIKVTDLQPGERVSYNGIFTAKRPMRIGVLALGYYEGVPRELSNIGVVTHGSKALPIVGRINMNHTIIDLTRTSLGIGDEVTLISTDPTQPNSIAKLREDHGLFPYLVLTKLSSSIRRRIV
jgi:alanine racemase